MLKNVYHVSVNNPNEIARPMNASYVLHSGKIITDMPQNKSGKFVTNRQFTHIFLLFKILACIFALTCHQCIDKDNNENCANSKDNLRSNFSWLQISKKQTNFFEGFLP